MLFVYPYKRKENDFLINLSIRCVRKHYPEARIVTVGDTVEGVANITFKDSNKIKGANVTAKCLHVATLHDSFVYMNDDFFINDNFDFTFTHRSVEQLERKEGKASIAWQQATDNSKHFLQANKFEAVSYECHQPCIFDSKKLIQTFKSIDWTKHDHFIKSLYFNINTPPKVKEIPNVKLIRPEIFKAKKYLDSFGCFSVGHGFLTPEGCAFIQSLS